jgi:glycolate oxidase iron-sulfur subunit
MLQPEIAAQLGKRKALHIQGTGAAVVAAGNLGCMTQIGLYSGLPIVHTVELLDWATGGPRPAKLNALV